MRPNLIIIGAMKCGTTSLHFYLDQHPEIGMSTKKETDFFTDRVWGRGVEWYEQHFEGGTKIRGEASPTARPRRAGTSLGCPGARSHATQGSRSPSTRVRMPTARR